MSPRRQHSYWLYILSNVLGRSGTLYVGVTNNLQRRVREHTQLRPDTFTGRYGVTHLVHCEEFRYISDAIGREKQIKGWGRSRKLDLIEAENPGWVDLSAEWFTE
ncbi:MAG: GIY-YIG nuclease family protein [Thermomicrobiales bacterium]|nr:GIY-YIG nuclease family protein [Thermomicrobiales bacterium]